MHTFHALHGIVITAPHRDGAIGMPLDLGLDRHERRRPVMLRPVEFDAAGDPWARQTHKSRLDHILPIEEIVSVGFVETDVNAAANLR